MKNLNKKIIKKLNIMFIVAALCLCTGCERTEKNTEIVFTTDFEADEVFRIDHSSCKLPEVKVYMYTLMEQYEELFGNEIWKKDIGDGRTLSENLKDMVLGRLTQIKIMNLLADKRGMVLTEAEEERVRNATEEYMSLLTKEEKKKLSVDKATVRNMYYQYVLAQKVYEAITKDINPEISDDEARTIVVKHILLKTYEDVDGKKITFDKEKKKQIKKQADELLWQLSQGKDFDELCEEYNEDNKNEYSFGKGSMPEAFEKAAFNLKRDEISEVIETEYGYHIIKCVSTLDRDETDENKEKIVRDRKNEAFSKVYNEFAAQLYSNLNEKLWESLTFETDGNMEHAGFFEVYEKLE